MKVALASDIHLDCVRDTDVISFGEEINRSGAEAILLTGDISTSENLVYHLSALERICGKQIYFVCGNHDFYNSSFDVVRKRMKELNGISQFLRYLSTSSYIPITNATALVGHDGWYDAMHGDYSNTHFFMNDWIRISDFVAEGAIQVEGGIVDPKYNVIVNIARQQALSATTHVADAIKAAVRYHKIVVIATHVPPFVEALVSSEPNSTPWYSSKIMGDMIRRAAAAYPNVRFEVFCGHTHRPIDKQIAHNLYVHVSSAEYGSPTFNVLELP